MTQADNRLAFDKTTIVLAYTRPLATPSAGILVPGNLRGVMAAGLAGEVRVRAGRSIEDQLLQHRPFSLGNAYPTGAGLLERAGVTTIAHAITATEPGERPRAVHSERAARMALSVLEDAGVRTITLPLINTVSGDAGADVQGAAYGALIAGHLRRRSRLRQLTVAGLDREFLAAVQQYLVGQGAHSIDE